jgi:hypothetical protein
VSSFWILANDSRVQIAVGREVVDRNIIPRLSLNSYKSAPMGERKKAQ